MTGKPRQRPLDQNDWARLFIDHMAGKSVAEIAQEQNLSPGHVADTLRAWKRTPDHTVAERLRQAVLQACLLTAAALATGDDEKARRLQALTQHILRTAKALGLNMKEKDTQHEGDQRDLADLPDPRIELLARFDRLAAARSCKSLAEGSQRRSGEAPAP